MNEVLLKNEIVEIELNDSILVATWKHIAIDMNVALYAVESRLKVSNGLSYPILIDIKNVTTVSKEARDFLASKEGCKGVTASAILINSAITSMVGNFFIKINKPLVPTKLFTDKSAAIKWLSKYRY